MPATGLLALLDDIATMSKIAAQKTAGISGDDLAVNSRALHGIDPKRELPIVYKVAKGSLKNKAILIPTALALNFLAPWAIMPLLTLGGAYLCYEGVEKILHKESHGKEAEKEPVDAKALEEKKIKSAIKTDMILSAEIVVVSLGAVAASAFLTQVAVLMAVGLAMTVGIYGLVGGIVKLDDIGLHLAKKKGDSPHAKMTRAVGRGLVNAVPPIMKGISVLGTAAMFMVGGGLILHGIPAAGHGLAAAAEALSHSALVHGLIESVGSTVVGLAAGFAAIPATKILSKPVAFVTEKCEKLYRKIFKKKPAENKSDNTAPAPSAAPQAEPQLTKAPAPAEALNAAATKPLNDDKPVVAENKPAAGNYIPNGKK